MGSEGVWLRILSHRQSLLSESWMGSESESEVDLVVNFSRKDQASIGMIAEV